MIHRCGVCGKIERPDRDIWLHQFDGEPGYGSRYDGEQVSLYFCSECLDNMVHTDNLLHETDFE